jgi:uncharacterized protein (TIGR03435 family)
MSKRIAQGLIAIIATATVCAQASTPAEFEVASVKPNKLNDRIVSIEVGPGSLFTARGYSLKLLIQRAYGVMGWEILGGPGWLDDDRFDVAAKAPTQIIGAGNLTEAQLKPMLRAMLADRFKLHLHMEDREMSAYALTIARGGPKLTPSADGQDRSDSFRLNQNGLKGQGIPMSNFARYIGGKLGLTVVDRTGLTGFYDFNVDWTLDEPVADMREALRDVTYRALQEKLGLKLTAQKMMLPMIVIDSAEKPSAN